LKNKMQMILLRHMQTQYNVRGILQGRLDIPILPPDPGQKSIIEKNKNKITQGSYTHILVSNLKRTWETADLYVNSYTVEPLLDELDFGEWEGHTKSAMIQALPQWRHKPNQLILGEPLLDLENRVKAFLSKYEPAKRILVFGHGSWIRALLSLHRSGSIRNMNKIIVPNNKLIFIEIVKEA